jgi:hypothetical protein
LPRESNNGGFCGHWDALIPKSSTKTERAILSRQTYTEMSMILCHFRQTSPKKCEPIKTSSRLENAVTSHQSDAAFIQLASPSSVKASPAPHLRRCAGYVWKLYPICLWVKLRYRYPSNATPGRALEKLWTQLPTTWSLVQQSWMSPTASMAR